MPKIEGTSKDGYINAVFLPVSNNIVSVNFSVVYANEIHVCIDHNSELNVRKGNAMYM